VFAAGLVTGLSSITLFRCHWEARYVIHGCQANAGVRNQNSRGTAPRTCSAWFFWGGMKLGLVGVALGLCGALVLTRFIQQLLFGLTAFDPMTFTVTAALLLSAIAAACYCSRPQGNARRSHRSSPISVKSPGGCSLRGFEPSNGSPPCEFLTSSVCQVSEFLTATTPVRRHRRVRELTATTKASGSFANTGTATSTGDRSSSARADSLGRHGGRCRLRDRLVGFG
jgi:hypothetical protein